MEFKLGLFSGSRAWGPTAVVLAGEIFQWARAVWIGQAQPVILEEVWRGARIGLRRPGSPWEKARDPGTTVLLALASLEWKSSSATRLITATGRLIDLRRILPKAVADMVSDALVLRNGTEAMEKIEGGKAW